MQQSRAGLMVLLFKLGGKLGPLLVKLLDGIFPFLKSLFGIKSVGLIASVGLYAYLFTWQMGVALVVFIAIHEYGHLWAMKRCGIKTKGMFFIPLVGAVAVAEEHFGSARNEAYIAIMGPVFGIVGFVAPMIGLYFATGEAVWAAIAAIMTFVNLINLLPVIPLDGGRLLKSITYSANLMLSLALIVGISITSTVFGLMVGFTLIAYMALIGLGEISFALGSQNISNNSQTQWCVLSAQA